MKLLTKAIEKKLVNNFKAGKDVKEVKPLVKFFSPVGGCYLANY